MWALPDFGFQCVKFTPSLQRNSRFILITLRVDLSSFKQYSLIINNKVELRRILEVSNIEGREIILGQTRILLSISAGKISGYSLLRASSSRNITLETVRWENLQKYSAFRMRSKLSRIGGSVNHSGLWSGWLHPMALLLQLQSIMAARNQ